jgi:hypothetical protein
MVEGKIVEGRWRSTRRGRGRDRSKDSGRDSSVGIEGAIGRRIDVG